MSPCRNSFGPCWRIASDTIVGHADRLRLLDLALLAHLWPNIRRKTTVFTILFMLGDVQCSPGVKGVELHSYTVET